MARHRIRTGMAIVLGFVLIWLCGALLARGRGFNQPGAAENVGGMGPAGKSR